MEKNQYCDIITGKNAVIHSLIFLIPTTINNSIIPTEYTSVSNYRYIKLEYLNFDSTPIQPDISIKQSTAQYAQVSNNHAIL